MYAVLLSLVIFLASGTTGCAYRFGLSDRALPGGYSQVAIPIFKNKTAEVGIEPLFTNALIRRFERSQVAKVLDKNSSPVTFEGTILKVDTQAGAAKDRGSLSSLPEDVVLSTEYRLVITALITLKRKSDDRIIWEGRFANERVFLAPQLGTAIVNSANALYSQSARMHAIGLVAEEMMAEAHDRITENF